MRPGLREVVALEVPLVRGAPGPGAPLGELGSLALEAVHRDLALRHLGAGGDVHVADGAAGLRVAVEPRVQAVHGVGDAALPLVAARPELADLLALPDDVAVHAPICRESPHNARVDSRGPPGLLARLRGGLPERLDLVVHLRQRELEQRGQLDGHAVALGVPQSFLAEALGHEHVGGEQRRGAQLPVEHRVGPDSPGVVLHHGLRVECPLAVRVVQDGVAVHVQDRHPVRVLLEVVFDVLQHLLFQGVLLLLAGHGCANAERLVRHEGCVRHRALAAPAPAAGLFDEPGDVDQVGRGVLAEIASAEGGVCVVAVAVAA